MTVSIENEYGEKTNSEFGLSLANVTNITSVRCENNVNCKNENGEKPNNELSQSLANVNVGNVNENEENQNGDLGLSLATLTAVGMTEKEAETFMSKSEFDEKLSTSAAQLSYDEIDVNLRIEKMMNKNQSVTQHNLRVNRLAENMAACGEEIVRINNELSENAWAGLQMGENDIEYFCIIEEIVLETLEVALCRVREKENERLVMIEVTIGKRKRNPVRDGEVMMNSVENKKIKVTPQNRNLHQQERKRNTKIEK